MARRGDDLAPLANVRGGRGMKWNLWLQLPELQPPGHPDDQEEDEG